jgi:hypothetical protein
MGEDRYVVGGEERLKRASYQPNRQAVVEKSERNSEKITSGIFSIFRVSVFIRAIFEVYNSREKVTHWLVQKPINNKNSKPVRGRV